MLDVTSAISGVAAPRRGRAPVRLKGGVLLSDKRAQLKGAVADATLALSEAKKTFASAKLEDKAAAGRVKLEPSKENKVAAKERSKALVAAAKVVEKNAAALVKAKVARIMFEDKRKAAAN